MEKNPWLNCCSVFGRCATSEMQLQTQNLKLHTIKKINKYREIYLMLTDLLNIVCKDWHIPRAYLHTYNTTL